MRLRTIHQQWKGNRPNQQHNQITPSLIRSMDDRSGNAGLMSYTSIAETVAPMRIPSAYSNFINPNSPLHPPRQIKIKPV
jgi:hypothetical protein